MAFIALIPPIVTNVLQYGAVGDGTTDDTAAINTALAAIPTSTGGVLYFPPNKTYLTTGIDISAYNNGNLVIMGGGWSSILKLKNNANGYIIKNTSGGKQGIKICNLKLDCNSANQTSASGGIYGYKYRRCLIDFVWIHNPWQAGIKLTADIADFGYQNRISNCYIEGGMNTTSGTNAFGEGLRIENTDENMIYMNHFENNGNPNDSTFGFHIYDQNGLSSYLGNSFVNGMGAIKLDGLQCSIISNKFDSQGGNCVQINSTAVDTLFIHNHCTNIGYRASGGSANSINAVYLNATRCAIDDNYFEANSSATPKTNSFVKIDTGATYCSVQNNKLNVPSGAGTLTAPIYFVSGSSPAGTRVSGNRGFDSVNSVAIFITENHGSASITSGNTNVTVTHGLAFTPTLDQIQVTPQTTLGSAAKFWISNATSTTFKINVDVNPAQTVTFSWRADAGW